MSEAQNSEDGTLPVLSVGWDPAPGPIVFFNEDGAIVASLELEEDHPLFKLLQ